MECETKEDEVDVEGFEVVTDHEVKEARRNEVEEKMKDEDERIDSAIDRLEKEGVNGLGEADLRHEDFLMGRILKYIKLMNYLKMV